MFCALLYSSGDSPPPGFPPAYDERAPLPRWVWWGTLLGVGGVIALVVAGVALIGAGAADPPVAGPVAWADPTLAWAGGPQIRLVPGESAWLAAPAAAHLPPEAFTIRAAARLEAGSDPGAAWGLWLATGSGARVLYAISGEGYTTTRVCAPAAWRAPDPIAIEDCPALSPAWRWMPFVRIHPPGMTNTLALHREASGQVRLRINREILGAATVDYTGVWGVWVRGGRIQTARLCWEAAELRRRVSGQEETISAGGGASRLANLGVVWYFVPKG